MITLAALAFAISTSAISRPQIINPSSPRQSLVAPSGGGAGGAVAGEGGSGVVEIRVDQTAGKLRPFRLPSGEVVYEIVPNCKCRCVQGDR